MHAPRPHRRPPAPPLLREKGRWTSRVATRRRPSFGTPRPAGSTSRSRGLVKSIQRHRQTRNKITPAAYAKLKAEYNTVVARAQEYTRTSPSHRQATVAAVTRELLRLADQLDLAAALVRNEYWVGKGHEDLVFERDNKPIGGTT